MSLSSDLISQFVKVTNDKKETKKETTVYGTTIKYKDTMYVKIDGSELLTPISSTADVKENERVTVMIKNHTATVTGNLTSPAARSDDVKDIADAARKISEFEIIIADKASVEALEAEIARIDSLTADNVIIKNQLKANTADIAELKADNVTISGSLTAAEADITKIKTDKLDAAIAEANYAKITDLNATNADVNNLEASYGNISSLIFGSATGTTIQTSFSNAVIAQLGDAQIKSAMIESIAASKITSGDIITNNIRVKSQNGLLLISDETIQISDNTRVRVQIGKDAAGDYSINIWDADGKLMFSEGGITDSAIKDAIIRNDMVSDTANIAAHKLDIDSLFDEINGSTNTIKSTQIYLDDEGQTLDVAFKSLTTDTSELQNRVTSQGTTLSAIQGQIASKVWQQDINAATDEMSTQYSTLSQELDSISATVASNTSAISKKADSSTVTTVNNKVTSLEADLSGFQTTVSSTYVTKNEVANIKIGGRNWLLKTDTPKTVTGDNTVNQCIMLYSFIDEVEKLAGKKISISFEYVISDYESGYFRLQTANKAWIGVTSIITPSEDGTYVKQGSMELSDATGYTYIQVRMDNFVGSITFSKMKIEIGDKCTDWTPATEDLATSVEVDEIINRVSLTETSITQNADSISAVATRTTNNESAIASLELEADGLTARIDTNEKDIITAQTTADAAKKQLYHSASGTSGTAGYVGICQLKVSGSYQNRPILFELSNRGRQSSNVSLCFNNTNNSDPGLYHFQRDGGIGVWAYKSNTSTWQIIAQKSEGYDTIYVKDYSNTNGNVKVTWANVHYDALPETDITEATLLAGKLAKSVVDNAAKTATNYLNFSNSGLVVGDHTGSSLGKNVLIDSDSVDIRNGSTVLASFGANTVVLGQNAEDSVINLCDGAGTIKTVISEVDDSYPRYDSLALESQQLKFSGKRIDMDVAYDNGTALKESSMTLMSGNSGIGSDYTITASGNKNQVGVAGAATENYVSSHYDIYAENYTASTNTWLSNRVSVYPLRTQFSKEITIMGNRVTGANNVLWTGGYYMTAAHSCTLSEGVYEQTNGIVLIFSEYRDGAVVNNTWHSFFVPKEMVVLHGGAGHCFQMSTSNLAYYATKYLYISNTKITGHDNNTLTGSTDSGITKACNRFVLRYVIGV